MDPYIGRIIHSWALLFLQIAGIILAALLLLRLYDVLRALAKRVSLLVRLKKVCREQNIAMTVISSPYRSVLKPSQSSEILFVKEDVLYSLKFFPCLRFRDTYLFDQDGRYHLISTFNPIYLNLRYYTWGVDLYRNAHVLLPMTLQYKDDIVKKTKKTNFADKDVSGAVPLLCMHPVPCEIQKVEGTNRKIVCDGDTVCGYTVYSAAGLLKMLRT